MQETGIKVSFRLGPGPVSRAIAWWGQGYRGWSHCDAILSDGRYLGARSDNPGGYGSGIVARPKDYEVPIREEIIFIPTPAEVAATWENWLLKQCGCRYDSEDIVSLIVGSEAKARPGFWICSAMQLKVQQNLKIQPTEGIEPPQTPPNMLRAMMLTAMYAIERGPIWRLA